MWRGVFSDGGVLLGEVKRVVGAKVGRRLSTVAGPYGPQPEALAKVNSSPRYASGATTFFRLEAGLECEIGVVGVPYDGGVTNRPGTRHGPRAVREQTSEHIRATSKGVSPFEMATFRDVGDVVVQRPYNLVDAHEEIRAGFADLKARGITPLTVGGDHSISLPILRALKGDAPIALIHVDAHADTGDDYLGSRFHHGAPFKIAVDEGLIDPHRAIQIGIRGTLAHPDAWKFSYDAGMTVVPMDDFDKTYWGKDRSLANLAADIHRVVGDGPVYITFDIDALDPVFAPGTGTPESGGMSIRQAQTLLRAILHLRLPNVVGADLVEVSPPFCSGYITAFNAANILHDLACILATSNSIQRASR